MKNPVPFSPPCPTQNLPPHAEPDVYNFPPTPKCLCKKNSHEIHSLPEKEGIKSINTMLRSPEIPHFWFSTRPSHFPKPHLIYHRRQALRSFLIFSLPSPTTHLQAML